MSSWPPPYTLGDDEDRPLPVPAVPLPSLGQLDYFTKAGTALLLALALPYVIAQLFRRPRYVIQRAGRHHLS